MEFVKKSRSRDHIPLKAQSRVESKALQRNLAALVPLCGPLFGAAEVCNQKAEVDEALARC